MPHGPLKFALLVLLALFALTNAGAQESGAQESKAAIQVNIGRPGDRAVPIALPATIGGAPQSAELMAIVRRDLELSGWFKILPAEAQLEPPGAGIRPGEFDFADWRPLGAAVLAKTSAVVTGDKLRAEVWVYEVAGGEKLGATAFTAGTGGTRGLAHRIADQIVFLVTGEHGFFDTKFTYVGNFTGHKEIYTSDVDGFGQAQITKYGSISLRPKWNAAGSAIAFTSFANGNPDLYVADLAARQIRRVSARTGINSGGVFSPAGDVLALTQSPGGDSEIVTVDPWNGREIARLTKSPGIDVSPSWSPDGSQIAFVSERSGGPQIYVMGADGSNPHRVTFSGAHNTDPAWSPKGDRIAFVGRDGGFDVFTVRTDGTGMTRVTQGTGDNEDPSWSPDGQYLAFASTRASAGGGGGSHIWIASSDGRHQVQITSGKGGYSNPHWSGHRKD